MRAEYGQRLVPPPPPSTGLHLRSDIDKLYENPSEQQQEYERSMEEREAQLAKDGARALTSLVVRGTQRLFSMPPYGLQLADFFVH